MGLTFLMDTAYLLPLTIFFLAVSVGTLGFRANGRRGYGPFAVGVLGAIALVVGKFLFDSNEVVYGSVAVLILASLWNSWPRRASQSVSAPPTETLHQIGRNEKELNMTTKRKIEVFSAGCPACNDTIALVNSVACPSCEVSVLDMNDPQVASRAKSLGVRSVPAVVIDGKLADCCAGRGPVEATLRAAGLGQAI